MSWHHRRLDPRRWRRVRRLVLDRDGWRCRACGKASGLQVDHVVPIDKGGAEFDPANLQSLCGGRNGCHARKTAGENRRQLTADETAWRRLVAERMRT